jgi:hypothetical protein
MPYSKSVDLFDTFPNPYNKVAHMNYPHSSIWLEGDKIMDRVIAELAPKKIEFIVEAGSMHGGSAISMAMQLDKRKRNRGIYSSVHLRMWGDMDGDAAG